MQYRAPLGQRIQDDSHTRGFLDLVFTGLKTGFHAIRTFELEIANGTNKYSAVTNDPFPFEPRSNVIDAFPFGNNQDRRMIQRSRTVILKLGKINDAADGNEADKQKGQSAAQKCENRMEGFPGTSSASWHMRRSGWFECFGRASRQCRKTAMGRTESWLRMLTVFSPAPVKSISSRHQRLSHSVLEEKCTSNYGKREELFKIKLQRIGD